MGGGDGVDPSVVGSLERAPLVLRQSMGHLLIKSTSQWDAVIRPAEAG